MTTLSLSPMQIYIHWNNDNTVHSNVYAITTMARFFLCSPLPFTLYIGQYIITTVLQPRTMHHGIYYCTSLFINIHIYPLPLHRTTSTSHMYHTLLYVSCSAILGVQARRCENGPRSIARRREVTSRTENPHGNHDTKCKRKIQVITRLCS